MGNLYEMDALNLFRQPPAALRERLTPRQLDVLELLCEGLPNKLIGRRLNISSATVKIHVASILHALNVSSRLQAVVTAYSLGFQPRSGAAETTRPETASARRSPSVLRLVLGDDDASHALAALAH